MHNLEKSPGMFSDRPGTTPKSLDLVVSPTCLREKERVLLDEVYGLVGRGVRVTSIIRQVWPSAFESLHCHPTETVSGKFFPTLADRPAGGLSATHLLCAGTQNRP